MWIGKKIVFSHEEAFYTFSPAMMAKKGRAPEGRIKEG